MLKKNSSETFPDRILVIDDQRSLLRLMKTRLSNFGCTVVTVDSAEEAEQIIQWGERFFLIITDLKMPWLDGLEFCKRIKSIHPRISICALSGNIGMYDQDELKKAGFDGIYQKPINDATLIQILIDAAQVQP